MKCEICNKDINIKGFAAHITLHHNMSCQKYYDIYIKKEKDGICRTCGNPTKFLGIKKGYVKHCCNKCAQLDPVVKEKKAQTCITKYGVNNAYKSEHIKSKIRQTCKSKYGVDNVLKLDRVRQNTYKSINTDEVKTKISKSKLDAIKQFEIEHDCTLFNTLRAQYGQGWIKLPLERLILNGHASFIKNSDIPKIIECVEQNGSSFEYDVRTYIKSIYNGKIIINTRSVISPLELDIYIPEKKLAIECNGIFWHSSLNNCDTNYHYNKSIECQKLGIRLIHIYETEWFTQQDQIKQLLNVALGFVSRKIYARQCEIKPISDNIAKSFNNKFHLQKHKKAQITYGLFYENELLQIMSFSKSNIKNKWKIIRNCSCSNTIVIGGISKLFNHFVKNHKPNKIVSYCDFNKFDGKSYEILGMTCVGYTGPKKYTKYTKGIIWTSGNKKYEINL